MKQQTLVTFQSRPCLEEREEKLKEAPGAGICRPEGRVASPGPRTKVRGLIKNESSHVNDVFLHVNAPLPFKLGDEALDPD